MPEIQEPTSIRRYEIDRMLSAYNVSGRREFDIARATPDSEAPQSSFDSFAKGQGGDVVQLRTVTTLGHAAASAQDEHIAPVIQLRHR